MSNKISLSRYQPLHTFQDAYGKWADKTFPVSTLDTIASHFREEAVEFAGGSANLQEAVEWVKNDTSHKAPEQLTEDLYVGYIEHLISAIERTVDPSHDPVEAADCLLLMLHHAHKAGYDLFEEALKKAIINFKRDWDTADEGGHGHFKHT
jgi:NTP pyrophosphatase (non-canonical NTP hydrolase)